DHRVGPCWRVRAIGLVEAAALEEFLFGGLNQHERPVLGAEVETPVGEGERPLGGVAIPPQRLARLKIEASQESAPVPPIGSVETAIDYNHAAMMILHLIGGVDFLGLDFAAPFLHQFHRS